MPDLRSYCGHHGETDCSPIELSPEESSHLVAANRARKGDPVTAFNGKGREWECSLVDANKRKAILLPNSTQLIPESSHRIALAQSIPKGKTLEAIIRRATEIGTAAIHPIIAERTEFKLPPQKRDTKENKWSNAAIEGGKQSGNPHLPHIDSPRTVFDFIDTEANSYETKLIACLREGCESIKSAFTKLPAPPKSAVILVGPEGDFSPQETDAAIAAGFIPVTLGPHVLRCETAAVSCLSILRHQLDS